MRYNDLNVRPNCSQLINYAIGSKVVTMVMVMPSNKISLNRIIENWLRSLQEMLVALRSFGMLETFIILNKSCDLSVRMNWTRSYLGLKIEFAKREMSKTDGYIKWVLLVILISECVLCIVDKLCHWVFMNELNFEVTSYRTKAYVWWSIKQPKQILSSCLSAREPAQVYDWFESKFIC